MTGQEAFIVSSPSASHKPKPSALCFFGGADKDVHIFRCLQEEYERRRGAFEKGEEEVTRMVEQRAAQEERLGNLVIASICNLGFGI
jgi:hypothetical protein